jgi:hypothetical protein
MGGKNRQEMGGIFVSQYIAKKIIRLRFFAFSQANYFCVSDRDGSFRPI